MCFKSKFDKLKREDVVNAICQLEEEEMRIESSFERKDKEIEDLMQKGRAEKNQERRIFWAKKINQLKEQRKADIDRAMFLMYNIRLLEKLKTAIDDKTFMGNVASMDLNRLLGDQKGLASFLNKALRTKVSAEQMMTSADQVFMEVQSVYEPNEQIYNANENDNDLLTMFETQDTLEMEEEVGDLGIESKANTPLDIGE